MSRLFNSRAARRASVPVMTSTDAQLPLFPVPAPDLLAAEPEPVVALLAPVLDGLADLVAGIGPQDLTRPTPCPDFDAAALLDHVLGWLQFFAAAFTDPDRLTTRPDPLAYRAADDDRDLGQVVRDCASALVTAVRGGVQQRDVAMSQARMSGPSAIGMVLGEYVVHGWDLARATGRDWDPPAAASQAALDFFAGMIAPEYRGDGGYFAAEVAVPADAPALDRLIGFAGRDPGWA